jgi:hypothetical protein
MRCKSEQLKLKPPGFAVLRCGHYQNDDIDP